MVACNGSLQTASAAQTSSSWPAALHGCSGGAQSAFYLRFAKQARPQSYSSRGRVDPTLHLPRHVDTEANRVRFMHAGLQAASARGGLRLNARRLYAADASAVPELARLAALLLQAPPGVASSDAVRLFRCPSPLSTAVVSEGLLAHIHACMTKHCCGTC